MKKVFLTLIFSVFFSSLSFAQDLSQIKKAKPFKISGSASLRGIYMNNGNELKGGTPFSYMLTGSPTISIYGLDIPLNFIWSPQGKEFQQPFNQYGASPHYKWATVHLGYRNINYNPYTLGGHTMLGAGFDLTPKKWKIGFMYGRLAAATKIDTISQTLQPVSFTRKGIAGKIGYGNTKHNVDWSFLTAQDDSASLKVNLSALGQKYGKEITPSGNFVTGIIFKTQLTKNFFWEGNYALSLYTRDLRNPSSIGEPNNSFTKQLFRRLIYLNQSTEFYKAIQTSIGYKLKNFNIKLRYLRIEPEFKSMGAYFINNDVQNITLMPSFTLMKKKVNINSSIGIQNDNLNKLKRTTSNRVIGSIAVNAFFSKKFILTTNYSNYSINQAPNIQRIADTFRITQTTQNLSFTPIYTLTNTKRNQTFLLNINYNKLNDFNTTYAISTQNRTLNTMSNILSYKITNNATKLGYTFGVNYNKVSGNLLNDNNVGGTFGIDKTFKKDKATVAFNNTVLSGKRNNSSTLILSSGLTSSIKLNKMHSFSLGAFLNHTTLKNTTSTSNISFFRGDVAYIINF